MEDHGDWEEFDNTEPHYHKDERGVIHKCYHECKSLLTSIPFWAGLTLSFPLEHFIWEKVWPFYKLTELLGL